MPTVEYMALSTVPVIPDLCEQGKCANIAVWIRIVNGLPTMEICDRCKLVETSK